MLLLFVLLGLAHAGVLHFPLNQAFGRTLDVEIRSKLFFSSSSPREQIEKIKLINGKYTASMSDFYNFVSDDYSKISLIMRANQVHFETTLTNDEISKLEGYVYVTTRDQADNPDFKVFDVNRDLFIKRNFTIYNSTYVFINFPLDKSNNVYQPRLSAKVTGLKVNNKGSVRIYRGVPPASMDKESYDDVMFQNPITLDGNIQYLNNVQPMQINFEAWYISDNKGYEMRLSRSWDDPRTLKITSTDVTGLITNNNAPEDLKLIVPIPDYVVYTTSGFFYNAELKDNQKMVIATTNLQKGITKDAPRGSASVHTPAEYFQIYQSSGIYGIQYFQIDISYLEGYVYICSKAQGEDPYFSVYDVKNYIMIGKYESQAKMTIVFINFPLHNPKVSYRPRVSAKISDLRVADDGSIRLYRGFPPETTSRDNYDNLMFQNPITLDNTVYYFNKTEPMQVNFEAWYIIADKGLTLTAERLWEEPKNSTVFDTTTTGLITCNNEPEDLRITIPNSHNANTVSGFFFNGFVEKNVVVSTELLEQSITKSIPRGHIYINNPADYIQISQSSGVYGVQFFQIGSCLFSVQIMTRHGKNCTASSVYSYHERKRDAKASGYGTLHARLGADSIKEFHCCSLTLQPCRQPVITPHGYIYDKQAILENILAQKKEYARKMKIYEKQCLEEQSEKDKASEADTISKKNKFSVIESTPSRTGVSDVKALSSESGSLKRPSGVISSEIAAKVKATGNEGDMSNMRGDKSTSLPSFWIPELNPTAAASKIEKPSSKVLCPISGKPLKVKDLLDVEFLPMPGTENNAKKQFICPVTRDELTNTTRCAYLKKSKAVVKYDVVEQIIKDEGVDPICGEKMTLDDIIELQRGGTGYAATNEVKAKLIRPQLELQ
ncbi:unnamed protein product [Caenorhabditis bovis]|uniref:Nitric oxide synthase-interacting protein zinc-finger domain-containing protein n=1 Tax=Caenorhabditis bovis TaxID=2654633 RepID=A0A8S1F9Y1_9PELO|nr:unnamed protein product [Caenorhabditis bovis]